MMDIERENYVNKERNDFIYSVRVVSLKNAIDYINSYWVWYEIQRAYPSDNTTSTSDF